MSGRFYARVRAVCCSVWGIPPWEFDEAAEAERFAAEDALEAMLLRGIEPFGGNVLDFLFREKAARRRAKVERARELAKAIELTTNDEKRARLAAELDEINKG